MASFALTMIEAHGAFKAFEQSPPGLASHQ
jgi:hypothetical protein